MPRVATSFSASISRVIHNLAHSKKKNQRLFAQVSKLSGRRYPAFVREGKGEGDGDGDGDGRASCVVCATVNGAQRTLRATSCNRTSFPIIANFWKIFHLCEMAECMIHTAIRSKYYMYREATVIQSRYRRIWHVAQDSTKTHDDVELKNSAAASSSLLSSSASVGEQRKR